MNINVKLPKLLKKRYKFRIYPNEDQKKSLEKVFGCCRYVYNRILKENLEAYHLYKETGNKTFLKSTSSYTFEKYFTEWRNTKETNWLAEPSSQAIRQVTKNLSKAFINFYTKNSKYPVFKKKNSRQAAEFSNNSFLLKENSIRLHKIKDFIKINFSRKLPIGSYTSCVVSKESTGKYFLSFIVNIEKTITKGEGIIGIDAGITDLFTFSDGTTINNPKNFFLNERRLSALHGRLSKKKRNSNNRKKLRLRLAKLHEKIRNQRVDLLHKVTTKLVRENQAICIEQLLITDLIKTSNLKKHIADAGWGMFRSMLMYKTTHSTGCKLYLADPYFPSTQLCSCCGRRPIIKIKLGVKNWVCSYCDTHHQRDHNAALNLKNLALTMHQVFKEEKDSVFLVGKYLN